ncbi:hypothetical protein FHG87_013461 [Trinorchestia longiramus]|nr:hypothetical protein FHG87_013461 [Trinorchestia longiramus]
MDRERDLYEKILRERREVTGFDSVLSSVEDSKLIRRSNFLVSSFSKSIPVSIGTASLKSCGEFGSDFDTVQPSFDEMVPNFCDNLRMSARLIRPVNGNVKFKVLPDVIVPSVDFAVPSGQSLADSMSSFKYAPSKNSRRRGTSKSVDSCVSDFSGTFNGLRSFNISDDHDCDTLGIVADTMSTECFSFRRNSQSFRGNYYCFRNGTYGNWMPFMRNNYEIPLHFMDTIHKDVARDLSDMSGGILSTDLFSVPPQNTTATSTNNSNDSCHSALPIDTSNIETNDVEKSSKLASSNLDSTNLRSKSLVSGQVKSSCLESLAPKTIPDSFPTPTLTDWLSLSSGCNDISIREGSGVQPSSYSMPGSSLRSCSLPSTTVSNETNNCGKTIHEVKEEHIYTSKNISSHHLHTHSSNSNALRCQEDLGGLPEVNPSPNKVYKSNGTKDCSLFSFIPTQLLVNIDESDFDSPGVSGRRIIRANRCCVSCTSDLSEISAKSGKLRANTSIKLGSTTVNAQSQTPGLPNTSEPDVNDVGNGQGKYEKIQKNDRKKDQRAPSEGSLSSCEQRFPSKARVCLGADESDPSLPRDEGAGLAAKKMPYCCTVATMQLIVQLQSILRGQFETLQDELERRREECVHLRTVLATRATELRTLSSQSYEANPNLLNEDGELAVAYQTQKQVNKQLTEELSQARQRSKNNESGLRADVERLKKENERQQKLISSVLMQPAEGEEGSVNDAEPRLAPGASEVLLQSEVMRLITENLVSGSSSNSEFVSEAGVNFAPTNFLFASQELQTQLDNLNEQLKRYKKTVKSYAKKLKEVTVSKLLWGNLFSGASSSNSDTAVRNSNSSGSTSSPVSCSPPTPLASRSCGRDVYCRRCHGLLLCCSRIAVAPAKIPCSQSDYDKNSNFSSSAEECGDALPAYKVCESLSHHEAAGLVSNDSERFSPVNLPARFKYIFDGLKSRDGGGRNDGDAVVVSSNSGCVSNHNHEKRDCSPCRSFVFEAVNAAHNASCSADEIAFTAANSQSKKCAVCAFMISAAVARAAAQHCRHPRPCSSPIPDADVADSHTTTGDKTMHDFVSCK